MRILGVDPGYAIVGFGVLEYTGTTFTPITYGAITTAAETPFFGGWRAFIGIFGR